MRITAVVAIAIAILAGCGSNTPEASQAVQAGNAPACAQVGSPTVDPLTANLTTLHVGWYYLPGHTWVCVNRSDQATLERERREIIAAGGYDPYA